MTLQRELAWVPSWAFSLLVIAAALSLALAFYGVVVRVISRGLRRQDNFLRSLLGRTRGPGRLALCLAAFSWAVEAAPFPPRQTSFIQHGVIIAGIVLVGWVLLTALDIGSGLYLRRYRVDVDDNLLARKHLTQVRILRRVGGLLVILLTTGAALMTVPGVRQLGMSLLAAGGAAGIIVGLSLQPVLSNLMAGVQIALTQPIRIDDAVMIQGEFGRVEEINSSYVVIRLWDERRLVTPLKFFLEQPFQNWTRQSAELTGTVMFYVDWRVPVAPLRARFEEIVRASPLWNGRVCGLQLTDTRERTLELRGLVSAGDAGRLFDLRCEVREKMVAWLQAELPESLPRNGIEFTAPEAEPAHAGADGDAERRMQ